MGLAAQHLSPTGRLSGAVLRLNSRPVYDYDQPVLIALADGGFLAAWSGYAQDSSVLRARRFSPADTPRGADFDLNTIVPGPQDTLYNIKMAAAPGGGFAAAWRSFDAAQVATPYLRFFDAADRPLGTEVPGPTVRRVESMAFDDAGNLLVLWSVDRGTAGPDLEIQLLDRDGASLGTTERVASAASGRFNQLTGGSVAWSGSSWIVTWTAQMPAQNRYAVFVRRFAG